MALGPDLIPGRASPWRRGHLVDGRPRPASRPTALRATAPADLSGFEVTREFATSKDGTRVPINVIAAPGTPLDGTAPAG